MNKVEMLAVILTFRCLCFAESSVIVLPDANVLAKTEFEATDVLATADAVLRLADCIYDFRYIEPNVYLAERKAADEEDVKIGYSSALTRRAGVLCNRPNLWFRSDTSNDGPNLKICEAKWAPVRHFNFYIRPECRKRAIRHLKEAMKIQREKMGAKAFAAFAAEVARRAGLTESEMSDAGIASETKNNSSAEETRRASDKRSAGTEQ